MKNKWSLVLDMPQDFRMSHAVQKIILALNLARILKQTLRRSLRLNLGMPP